MWWLMPATAARRCADVSLARAYVIHVILSLITAGLITLLAIWVDESERILLYGLLQVIERFLSSILHEIAANPWLSLAVVAGVTMGVEAAVLALALLATPWGARDEPMSRSIANGLRRTWLNTVCAIPATLVIGLCVSGLTLALRDWERRYPPPSNPSVVDSAGRRMNAATQGGRNSRIEWKRRHPWYLRNENKEGLMGHVCFLAAAWFLWTVLRSVGADRAVPPPDRPPTCEKCGYNLTAARMDGHCPECGVPVVLSLGPDVRPGTPWQRRAAGGRWRAWYKCARDAVLRPRSFGRQIQVGGRASDHRLFLAMHLPAMFLVGFFGVILCYVAQMGHFPYRHDVEVLWLVAPFVGYASAISAFACVLATSWLVALYYQITDKRNLLAGATQMTSYLTTWVFLGICFAGSTGALTMALQPLFRQYRLAFRLGIGLDLLMFLGWLSLNLIWVAGYLLLVRRGMTGCRYANR